MKRSKGSVGGFTETMGGATADDGTISSDEWLGPETMQMGTAVGSGAQEKAGTDTGSEVTGKDSAASEKEGAAGDAVDMLAGARGVAEAGGMEKVGPGGWEGGKEVMDDIGAAGGSTADGETDGWGTGRLETEVGM